MNASWVKAMLPQHHVSFNTRAQLKEMWAGRTAMYAGEAWQRYTINKQGRFGEDALRVRRHLPPTIATMCKRFYRRVQNRSKLDFENFKTKYIMQSFNIPHFKFKVASIFVQAKPGCA